MLRRQLAAIVAVLAIALPAGAAPRPTPHPGFQTGSCAYPAGKPLPGSGAVRRVPSQYPTIQVAVDSASEGDMILIAPGVYREQVIVTVPGLRIVGENRSSVVLDGQNIKTYGFYVRADRVVIENMTGHNYVNTVFYWEFVTGYYGRYLTAYNTNNYGLYALGSRCGQFDHSYASGTSDSGFYIGECFPCDAVIHDVESVENALGYSGTNAGGDLVIRDSIWRNNGMGIVPNSLDGEERPPQRGLTIKNNLIIDNNNKTAPGSGLAGRYWGAGIVMAGSNGNQIYGNEVLGHELGGIVIAPLPDQNVWLSSGNTVWGNTVHGSADGADLAQGATSGPNNCWTDNDFGTSAPAEIETIYDCGAAVTGPGGDPRVEVLLIEGQADMNGRVWGDWRTWPAPTPSGSPSAFVQMPDDDGNGSYADDGAIDAWLPAVF